jgi:hypothetical protein
MHVRDAPLATSAEVAYRSDSARSRCSKGDTNTNNGATCTRQVFMSRMLVDPFTGSQAWGAA